MFEVGKVNYFRRPNGFGKTTIIDLLFGLCHLKGGAIIINNKYKLSELNLTKWRKKIAYAESANLVKSNLSLGQKQLFDLKEALKASKEIYLFDEASNNLDEGNRNVVEKKLVIVMTAK